MMQANVSNSTAVSIRIIESATELEGIRVEWDRLLQRLPDASIFSTPEWLLSWFTAYGEGRKPWVATFHDPSGEMIALAPMMLTTQRMAMRRLRVLQLLGDGSGDSDNLEILVVPGWEREVVSSLHDLLETEGKRWDIASFNTMPASSPAACEMMLELQRRRWSMAVNREPCCAIPLPPTWEAYLQKLSSNERQQIGYKSRRLEKKFGVKYVCCSNPNSIEERLLQLFDLHSKRWQKKGQTGSFVNSERRAFYRLLSSVLINRNWLELWVLELNEIPVAAQYVMRYHETSYDLQGGFDPAFHSASVGYVLRAHMLRNLIESGVRKHDHLGGVTDSKLRWGAIPGEYLFLTFARPATFSAAYIETLVTACRMREYLRTHAPQPVFDIIRRGYRFFVPLNK